MAANFDRSLDEIIKTTQPKRQQNGRFPGVVRRNFTKKTYRPPQRRYIPENIGQALDPNGLLSNKLNISNLHYGVTESDLESLFEEIGPVRTLTLHYDRSGRSLGSADVVFERRLDANKSLKAYNGVPLNGRPMKIEFNTLSTSSRLPRLQLYVPPIRNHSGGQRGRGGYVRRGAFGSFQSRAASDNASKYSNNRNEHINNKPTLEELDAELDEYVNSNSKTK